MKTLEQIKEEYAVECNYPAWEEFINDQPNYMHDIFMDKIAKLYATGYAKEALKNASESAEFIAEHQFYEETIKDNVDNVGAHLVFIDKQSILSENNLPKHK